MKYERLLFSYASSRGLARKCTTMEYVEAALNRLIERGLHKIHPDQVLVAVAAAMGEIAVSQFALIVFPFGRIGKDFDAQMHELKKEGIKFAVAWLASISGKPCICGRPGAKKRECAEDLLQSFLGERTARSPEPIGAA